MPIGSIVPTLSPHPRMRGGQVAWKEGSWGAQCREKNRCKPLEGLAGLFGWLGVFATAVAALTTPLEHLLALMLILLRCLIRRCAASSSTSFFSSSSSSSSSSAAAAAAFAAFAALA